MKIVITGVAGFLGSTFAKYILKLNKNIEIVGIDDLSNGFIENVPKEIKFIQADISEEKNHVIIEDEFKNVDYLFHFSAYAAEGLSYYIREFNYKSNVIASAFLINCSIRNKVKKFIFTSSMAVYGNQTPPFDESLVPMPCDPYGIAKYCIEMDLKSAYESHGLEYVIIRPHNVYGIGQNIFDPYRNVLGIWMYQILINKPITIYGDGEQKRAFSHIDDMLPCLWKSRLLKNEIVNLGSGKEYTINEMAKKLLKIACYDKVEHLEERKEVKDAWSTYQKSVDLLGYNEIGNVDERLKEMWDYYKNVEVKDRKFFSSYEINNVYSYWSNSIKDGCL